MEEISLCEYETRGLSEPIKMILKYLHVNYKTQNPDEADFIESLDFLAFPCIRDNTNGVEVVHAIAIAKYLAGKYRPKMLGSAMNEFAEVDTLLYLFLEIYKVVASDIYENLENLEKKEDCIIKADKGMKSVSNGIEKAIEVPVNEISDKSNIENHIIEKVNGINLNKEVNEDTKYEMKISKKVITWIKEKLCFVEKLLKGRNWLIGKQPSIADFFFAELLNFLNWADPKDEIKINFMRIKNHTKKFYLIPEMASYKAAQEDFDIKKISLMIHEL